MKRTTLGLWIGNFFILLSSLTFWFPSQGQAAETRINIPTKIPLNWNKEGHDWVTATVSFGSSKQVQLLVDTGSSGMLVFCQSLFSKDVCSNPFSPAHQEIISAQGVTIQDAFFTRSYGGGSDKTHSVAGWLAYAPVSFYSKSDFDPAIVTKKMPFMLATTHSANHEDDGTMGINPKPAANPVKGDKGEQIHRNPTFSPVYAMTFTNQVHGGYLIHIGPPAGKPYLIFGVSESITDGFKKGKLLPAKLSHTSPLNGLRFWDPFMTSNVFILDQDEHQPSENSTPIVAKTLIDSGAHHATLNSPVKLPTNSSKTILVEILNYGYQLAPDEEKVKVIAKWPEDRKYYRMGSALKTGNYVNTSILFLQQYDMFYNFQKGTMGVLRLNSELP